MIAALLLAASHVLGVCPETGVAEYYGSDELSAKVKEPLERRTYPVERTTDADRDAAMKALAGVKTIVVWHWNNARRIREIRDRAFEGAPDLERVLLRSGVRRVGSRVFAGCPRLVSVISECNAELDIADDAFTGVTNAVTLIECGPDRRHEILAGRARDASPRPLLLRDDLSAWHRPEFRQLAHSSEDACAARLHAPPRDEGAADRPLVDCRRVRCAGGVRMHGFGDDDRADFGVRQGGRAVVAGRRGVCGRRRFGGDRRWALVVQLGVPVWNDFQSCREGGAVQEQGRQGVRELQEVL